MNVRHSNRQAKHDRNARNRRRARKAESDQLETKFYATFGRDGE